jgi:hypothetical protein
MFAFIVQHLFLINQTGTIPGIDFKMFTVRLQALKKFKCVPVYKTELFCLNSEGV